jgi:hypothetical protein
VVTVPTQVAGSPQEVEAIVQYEHELYEPMRDVIASDWAKDRHARPLGGGDHRVRRHQTDRGIWCQTS